MYGGQAENIYLKLAEIPISVVLGIIVGLIPGYLLYRLFNKYDWKPPKRTLIVLGTAIALTRLEEIAEGIVPIASLLGVMAIGFIILEKSESIAHLISQKLKKLWVFAELLLFVLVGAQVNIHVAWEAGLAGLVIIFTGLLFRSAGTYVSLLGTRFTAMERLFCVIAYIPKATVQAAIGAVPLAAGVASGEVILAVAVLSILVTAPLGAVGIIFFGERILDQGLRSAYQFKELRDDLGLPRVGERVRSKRYGVVWKVIEEKELWLDEPRAKKANDGKESKFPAIKIRYWRQDTAEGPGTGRTLTFYYSKNDPSFNDDWEILYDW
jgi:NhaP-type Na+/H+ or K+/H+ antiporter